MPEGTSLTLIPSALLRSDSFGWAEDDGTCWVMGETQHVLSMRLALGVAAEFLGSVDELDSMLK